MTLNVPPPIPSRSTGKKFSDAIGAGLQGAQSILQQYQQQQQMQQENEAIKQNLGVDLNGINDPKQRQILVQSASQGANAREIEGMKQAFKTLQQTQKQDFVSQLLGGQNQRTQPGMNQEMNQSQDQMNPQEMGSQQPQEQFDPRSISDEDIVRATSIDKPLGDALRAAKDTAVKQDIATKKEQAEQKRYEETQRTAKEREYFKLNEPKVIELADTQRKLEMEQSRYERLNQLFSDPSQFPSSFTAALFTKDGNINDLVYSQLSPDAQESIKLIIDSTSNIKDTYGARVTNFDLQTYLKKLPSLLNSPEGKQRVLRDLQIMNQINQLHAGGIQDVFEEAGGTDKIPFSTAEKIYKKKYGNAEKQLREQFVHPEKGVFNEMPDPNKYLGKKIKNPETGEMFISDGVEWKPFKG
jgi:hypothetical protein